MFDYNGTETGRNTLDQVGNRRLYHDAVVTGLHGYFERCRRCYALMFEINDNQMTTFRLVPDKFLDNERVERLANALHDLYQRPIDRLGFDDKKLQYNCKTNVFYEIVITHDNVKFYLSTPTKWKEYTINQLETCWPKSTFQQVNQDYLNIEESGTKAATLNLKNHYFLSLETDERTNNPVPQLLEITKLMDQGDKAIIQFCLDPAGLDWFEGAQEAYEKFKKGNLPKRFEVSFERVLNTVARTGATVGMELMATLAELVTEEKIEPEEIADPDRVYMIKQGGLSNATKQKSRYEAFDTTIRVLAHSKDIGRRKSILRALGTAYQSLSNDNELEMKEVDNTEKIIDAIQNRKVPKVKVNKDYMSTAEVAKFIQLPCYTLQQEYGIESISDRELEVPGTMLNGGIQIGSITKKGESQQVHWPTHNKDELCLPRVVVGAMGSGKSLGFGAGFASDAIRQGYSSFVLDVSDGDMADTVRDSLPDQFPEDHIIDLDFGNTDHPIPLNWSEVNNSTIKSSQVSNVMANQLVNYLDKFSEESGARTARYMKAAAKAVYLYDPEATLLEVILMLLSEDYRKEVVDGIDKPRLQDMWKDFDNMKEGLRRQIIQPVLNRLDSLTGNEYIANCVMQKSKGKINFRKWADGDDHPYCVILRVPKSILWEDATDALASYLIAKVWLSILTRIDQPTNNRKPAFLIMDEPHQFLSSASVWRQMIVESRKWRLGLIFMFHDWGQIPNNLAKLIKSAGPHYTLYSSSKETFQDLEEEIKPFTVEEALQIKTHHAINIVKSGGERHNFLAKMASPPIDIEKKKDWRHEYIDRSDRTKECSKIFARPAGRVEENIYERESIMY